MIVLTFGGGGGAFYNFNLPLARDPQTNWLLNTGLMLALSFLPYFFKTGGILGTSGNYAHPTGSSHRYYYSTATGGHASLSDLFFNAIAPFLLGFALLAMLSGRLRGLSWHQAFLGFLRNPVAFLREGVHAFAEQQHGVPARPRFDRQHIAAALERLPVETFVSESTLSRMTQHELIERCRKLRISTQGCLERDEVVARLAEAGGTTSTSCSICLEEYLEGEDELRVLPCRHKLHRACFDQWAFAACDQGRGPTCPVCNYKIRVRPVGGPGPGPWPATGHGPARGRAGAAGTWADI